MAIQEERRASKVRRVRGSPQSFLDFRARVNKPHPRLPYDNSLGDRSDGTNGNKVDLTIHQRSQDQWEISLEFHARRRVAARKLDLSAEGIFQSAPRRISAVLAESIRDRRPRRKLRSPDPEREAE